MSEEKIENVVIDDNENSEEIIKDSNEIIKDSNEIITDSNEIITVSNEIITVSDEIITVSNDNTMDTDEATLENADKSVETPKENIFPITIHSLNSPPEDPVIEIKQEPLHIPEVIEIDWEPNPTVQVDEQVKSTKRLINDANVSEIPKKRIKEENGNAHVFSQPQVEDTKTTLCLGCEIKSKDICVLLMNFPKYWSAKQIRKCITSNCPTINATLNVSTKIKTAILRVKSFKYVKLIKDAFYGKKVLGNFIYVFVDSTGSVKEEFENQYKLANECKDSVAVLRPSNIKATARFSLFLPFWTVPPLDVWNNDPKGTYGLKDDFLQKLNIKPPLCCNILVSNVHKNFSVDKIKEVFLEAGHIAMIQTNVHLRTAKITYNHPVEAVQAISMFNGSSIFDTKMTVIMDNESSSTISLVKNIGPGLGLDKQPTRDVQMLYERMILAQYMNDPNNDTQNVSNSNVYKNAFDDVCYKLDSLIKNISQVRPPIGHNVQPQQHSPAFAQGPTNFIPNNSSPSNFVHNNPGPSTFVLNNPAPSNFVVNNPGPSNFIPNNPGPSNFIPNNPSPLNFNPNNPGPPTYAPNMSPNTFPATNFGSNPGQSFQGSGPYQNNNMINQIRPNIPPGVIFRPKMRTRRRVNSLARSDPVIYTKIASEDSSGNKSNMVVLEGLPDSVTRQVLENKMKMCGEVKFVEMTPKGRAFVRFENEAAAAKCIALFDKSRVDGCLIATRYF